MPVTTTIVTIQVDDHGVALLLLDDPARSSNVTSPELTAELLAAIDRVASDPAIRGAVIASGKPGRFIAGGDILDFVGAHERGMSNAEAHDISHRWNVDMRRIERCGKPFAAAINGPALGGGYELALCCQHRVLVDDPKAVVGLVEVGIGLLPAGGGSQRLPRLIGIDAALRAMIDARRWSPHEALAAGLVDAVVPAHRLIEAAIEWVHDAAQRPVVARQPWAGRLAPTSQCLHPLRQAWEAEIQRRFEGHYPAPPALLRAVFDGALLPLDEALALESRCFAPLLPGVVARNLMRTGFVFKAQADKLARVALRKLGDEAPSPEAAWPELDGPTCAAPGQRGAQLLLWPSAAHAQLAEILQPAAASPAAVQAALAQAARRRLTPVLLPAGQASFVQRLRLRWQAESTHAAEATDAARANQQRLGTALEAAQALAEGAIGSAADADLASVLGAGYPAWTGGALTHIDTLGARAFVANCDALARHLGSCFEPGAALRQHAARGAVFHRPSALITPPAALASTSVSAPGTGGKASHAMAATASASACPTEFRR
ncbi:enoyl-CoA hydratase-related protein [Aquabacterium sp.]|uniref:enoyl-CoA hydratase-related protein n=1 Tax=Aquabacterium sp. TaxID=1872578 RepID=UPI002C0FA996|nr:enoyl-CoA hydratase-related protein [Aquabacterium sp.]HSW04936.1 enoyl-CoA hydratase-related protein [Aquabacterium sp.]